MLKSIIRNSPATVFNCIKHRPPAVALLFLLFVFACSAVKPAGYQGRAGSGIPNRSAIDDVPFFSQRAYQCGPATLSMALGWSGIRVSPETVAPQVFTPSLKGSLQTAMIGTTRRYGRIAYPIASMDALLKELAFGHPVVVLQNLGLAWFPVWHYSLVIGYDLANGLMILHSGRTARKNLSLPIFERTWARSDYWGLLVLPPSRLPATATEREYISAVIGLENTRHWLAALEGYQTALTRWPNSLSAYIGTGNCYYELGQFEAAEVVLRNAADLFPREGAILNNLAQVLLEQKKYREALALARKAVQFGGPLSHLYQQTLEEILSVKQKQQCNY